VRLAVLLAFAVTALAQSPSGILDLFRSCTQALAEKQPDLFLDCFDPEMAGYPELRRNVMALLARGAVASTIEIAVESGDESTRMIQVDWLLRAGLQPPRRALLKLTVERRGRRWRITQLDPVSFFAP
jgi:hypothetical protein